MSAIAILCSDIHLSHVAPIARSAELNWYAAMSRSLNELSKLQSKLGSVPIICAGDIFDRWNSPPELVNFAIDRFPRSIAIPGQHDIPNHNMGEIHRSAFWTLHRSGVLDLGDDNQPYKVSDLITAHLFPWGSEVIPNVDDDGLFHLAVVHAYVWEGGFGFPGAPEGANLSRWKEKLKGYDAAVFGDNHQGFITKCCDCNVINCGAFFRRKSDERQYKPMVGILHSDGTIVPYHLDVSADKFIEDDSPSVVSRDLSDPGVKFMEELGSLGPDSLDFRSAVRRRLDAMGADLELRAEVEVLLG